MAVFESLLDVPLDNYQDDDGDDSQIPSTPRDYQPPTVRRLAAAAPPDPHLAVPYVYLKRGSRGKPVLALVRALSVAGYGKWKGRLFSNLLGVFAERNLNAFKKHWGLPENGVYDKATHGHLATFYDDYAIAHLLDHKTAKPTKDTARRNAFIAQLMFLYNRRSYEVYTQARAFDTRKPPRGLDCSASGEWAAKWAGLKSLSGFGAFGYGSTRTQLPRFRLLGAIRATIKAAQPGDPIFYGRGTDATHVAYWLGRDKDGTGRVWSFGGYPIQIHDVEYRHDRIAVADLLAGQ